MEAEFEVVDDPAYSFMIFDKSDDFSGYCFIFFVEEYLQLMHYRLCLLFMPAMQDVLLNLKGFSHL